MSPITIPSYIPAGDLHGYLVNFIVVITQSTWPVPCRVGDKLDICMHILDHLSQLMPQKLSSYVLVSSIVGQVLHVHVCNFVYSLLAS